MSKDLHNIDEFFKAAYEQFSDEPSSEVWKQINAGLDKKDAAAYKIQSKRWKQVAIVSLLMLSGFILNQTNILKTSFSPSNKSTIADAKKESKQNVELNSANKGHKGSLRGESSSSAQEINNQSVAEGNRINSDALVTLDRSPLPEKTITGNSTKNFNQEESGYDKKYISAIQSNSADNKKNLIKPGAHSMSDEIITPSVEEKYRNEISTGQLSYVPTLHLINNPGHPSKNSHPLERESKWAVSGFVSSDRAGYRLDKDRPTINTIKQHEEHQPSFSTGILITRQLKNRLSLQTGLIYSDIAIIISPQQIYASQNSMGDVSYKYITSSGNAYIKPGFASSPYPGDSLKTKNAQHNLQYLTIPLTIKHTLIKSKKILFSPGIGIGGNFLTGAKIETEVEGPSNSEHVVINKLEGMRKFSWSLIADASIDYRVNKRTSVNLRPFFSYALSPITSNNDIETFPYSFGLGTGLTYRF